MTASDVAPVVPIDRDSRRQRDRALRKVLSDVADIAARALLGEGELDAAVHEIHQRLLPAIRLTLRGPA